MDSTQVRSETPEFTEYDAIILGQVLFRMLRSPVVNVDVDTSGNLGEWLNNLSIDGVVNLNSLEVKIIKRILGQNVYDEDW